MSSCGVEKGYFFENGNLYIILGERKESTNTVQLNSISILVKGIDYDEKNDSFFKIVDSAENDFSAHYVLLFMIDKKILLTYETYSDSKGIDYQCLVINDYGNFQKLKKVNVNVTKGISNTSLIPTLTNDSFLFYKALKEIFTVVVKD